MYEQRDREYVIAASRIRGLVPEKCQFFVTASFSYLQLVKFPYLCDRMIVQYTSPASKEKYLSILEGTLKLIRQYGFHGTSMSQIAQEAQVATGTIYHYFNSKDDLMLAIFDHCKKALYESTFRNVRPYGPYRERLERIWLNLASFYIAHPDVLSFLEQFYSSPYVKQIMGDETICGQDMVEVFLREGSRDGHIKDVDENVISAAFIGTAVAAAKRTNNETFIFNESHMHHMLTILWDGIKV